MTTFHSICPWCVKKWRYFIEPRPHILMQVANERWFYQQGLGQQFSCSVTSCFPVWILGQHAEDSELSSIPANNSVMGITWHLLESISSLFIPLLKTAGFGYFSQNIHCTRKNTGHWKSTTLTSHQICCVSFIACLVTKA